MLLHLLMLSVFFLCQEVITQTTTECPGTWTEWIPVSGASCNDTCGMCGAIQLERSCQPTGCVCDDPTNTTMTGACGNPACFFPRRSCCLPYVKKVEGSKLNCALPTTSTTTEVTTTTLNTTPPPE